MQRKQGLDYLAEQGRENLLNESQRKPKVSEAEDPLAVARIRSKQRKADKQAEAEIDLDTMEMKAEIARLQDEVAERDRRHAAGEPPLPRAESAGHVAKESLMAQALILMESGVDPAIIGQVLQGQSANAAIRNPQLTIGGVPDWMGKIVTEAISSKDEVRTVKLEAEMENLKDKVADAIKAQTEAIKEIKKEEPFDPTTYAQRQFEGMKLFYDLGKQYGLIPEHTPQVSDAETGFKLQDRQWSHEERMGLLQAEQAKIESSERIETRKAQQRQEALARFPQAIGQAAAKALEDGMVARRQRQSQAEGPPTQRRRRRPVIQMEEGEEMAQVQCRECGQPITVVAGSKQAICVCGAKYPVVITPAAASEETTGESEE